MTSGLTHLPILLLCEASTKHQKLFGIGTTQCHLGYPLIISQFANGPLMCSWFILKQKSLRHRKWPIYLVRWFTHFPSGEDWLKRPSDHANASATCCQHGILAKIHPMEFCPLEKWWTLSMGRMTSHLNWGQKMGSFPLLTFYPRRSVTPSRSGSMEATRPSSRRSWRENPRVRWLRTLRVAVGGDPVGILGESMR